MSPNQSRQSSSQSEKNPDKIDDFSHRVGMRLNYKEESKLGGESAGNSLEPFTMNNVLDILAHELVILPDDDDPDITIRIHAHSLLLYIRS